MTHRKDWHGLSDKDERHAASQLCCSFIASCRPLVAPPSRPLVAPACCCIASPCPLVALHSRPPFHAGWLLRPFLACRPLVISSRHPLVISSRQLIVASRLVILSLHHPLVLLSRRLVVALPPLLALPSRPLVVPAIIALPLPSLTIDVERRQTLTPPSNATATTAIERHLYHPPLPQLPFIAVKHQHKPPSIANVKR